ncbi:unnamed protein product [Durusdinium trenchii]|uniref:tRNA (guanine(9)-N(1))-methyltransferase n=1 Tax=Durusdinium trenchii TaxID=1381693 RepID=A0ABP0LXY1_9DINO
MAAIPADLGESSSAEAEEKAPDKAEAKRLRKSERKEQKRLHAKEHRQQRNRAQKERKQELRKEKLESMSAEERAEFLEQERQAGRDRKAFLETSLTEAFERGRPRVVVNCSFDQSMDVRELTSLAKQIQLAYTQARNMGSKVQLHLTSLGPENRAWRGLEAQGVRGWKMHLHEKSVWEVFAEEARSGKLVILTPDADEELVDVSDEEVYVIGGIVDRSVKKMQSLAQAQELRKLPLKSFGPKGCCPVLNVDCVVRILCEWLRKRDWPSVFEECLPGRRLGERPVMSKRQRRAQRALEREDAGQAADDAAEDAADPESTA